MVDAIGSNIVVNMWWCGEVIQVLPHINENINALLLIQVWCVCVHVYVFLYTLVTKVTPAKSDDLGTRLRAET